MKKERGPFDGALQIIAFNWPMYATAVVALAALGWLSCADSTPRYIRLAAVVGLMITAYFTLASVAVSHYVYDRSRLYKFDWIHDCVTEVPARWVNLHAGLDESTAALEQRFGPPIAVLDVFTEETMPEASIARARRRGVADRRTTSVRESSLPLESDSCDCACVIFAAHELRAMSTRVALFVELRRVLAQEGRVILVEHLRDVANFAAFGPGFLHFLSLRTWHETIQSAGLQIVKDFKMTPFVRVLVLHQGS